MTTVRTVREAATAYLDTKHVTLWGDWDITRPDSREQAIDWLTTQVEGVLRHKDPATFFEREPEVIVTEQGKTITVDQPQLPWDRQPILPHQPYRVRIDPYRVDL